MADTKRGRRLAIGPDRSLVLDILHAARRTPATPAERQCDLARVDSLRQAAETRISWSVVFLKAYALLTVDHPRLRQAWIDWPRPHLYEHPASVASMMISRPHRGSEWLFVGRFAQPESQRLTELQRQLDRYCRGDVEDVFKRQLRLAGFPTPVRRLLWWFNLRLHGPTRARRMGTFSISTLAGQGTLNRGHPLLLTTSLAWGPLDEAGRAAVTLLYDHRVMDGLQAARCLNDLQSILAREVAAELEQLGGSRGTLPFRAGRPQRRAA